MRFLPSSYVNFYIDNTNLTSNQDHPIIHSTLIACSFGENKRWYLASLLFLHLDKVVVLFCRFDANKKQFMHACNTREINPSTTRLEIHYLNRGHNNLICNSDNCTQCDIDGPDKVLMTQHIHQLMKHMWIKGVTIQNVNKLYLIKETPLFDINPCRNKFAFS